MNSPSLNLLSPLSVAIHRLPALSSYVAPTRLSGKPSLVVYLVKAPFAREVRPPRVPTQSRPSRDSVMDRTTSPASPSFAVNTVTVPSRILLSPDGVPIHRVPSWS